MGKSYGFTDLAQDEQWDSKKSKSKGKSCNIVSILSGDDNIMIASLSDSESERHAFTVQLMHSN